MPFNLIFTYTTLASCISSKVCMHDVNPWKVLRKQKICSLVNLWWAISIVWDTGKSSPFAEDATVNSLLPQARRKLRMLYMQRLNWNNRIKQDIIHRQVMQTIRRYRNEDDMDFDEALKAAIDRRKYLFSWLIKDDPSTGNLKKR